MKFIMNYAQQLKMNNKDERIVKLWRRGLTEQQIAKKLGAPDNLERVRDGLVRSGILFSENRRRGKDDTSSG